MFFDFVYIFLKYKYPDFSHFPISSKSTNVNMILSFNKKKLRPTSPQKSLYDPISEGVNKEHLFLADMSKSSTPPPCHRKMVYGKKIVFFLFIYVCISEWSKLVILSYHNFAVK